MWMHCTVVVALVAVTAIWNQGIGQEETTHTMSVAKDRSHWSYKTLLVEAHTKEQQPGNLPGIISRNFHETTIEAAPNQHNW